jgi:hypothetical protein
MERWKVLSPSAHLAREDLPKSILPENGWMLRHLVPTLADLIWPLSMSPITVDVASATTALVYGRAGAGMSYGLPPRSVIRLPR